VGVDAREGADDGALMPIDPARRPAAVKIVFITIFLDLFGFGVIVPQLPYYADACGAGGFVIGLVGASYSLLQFLMAPWWGRLSDRVGRRPIILVGLAGAGLSYLVFGATFRIAALTGISPLVLLFVSRAMAGFFNANLATAQACMADLSPGPERAAAMGLVGAAFGLGFVLGPAVSGGVWALTKSAELPFYLAGLCELATFAWAWFALPETKPDTAATLPRPAGRFGRLAQLSRPARLTMLVYFLSTFAMAGMENTLGLFVMGSPHLKYDNLQFAALLLYLGVAIVITQGWAVKRLSRRWRETQLLPAGAGVMIFGLGLTAFVTTSWQIYLLMGLLCFGYGLVSPSLSSLASLLAPEEIRGEMLGMGQSMASLGRIVGPVVGGWAFEKISPGSPYVLGGALSLVCVVLGLALHRMVGEKELR
jgi:MFS family permease